MIREIKKTISKCRQNIVQYNNMISYRETEKKGIIVAVVQKLCFRLDRFSIPRLNVWVTGIYPNYA